MMMTMEYKRAAAPQEQKLKNANYLKRAGKCDTKPKANTKAGMFDTFWRYACFTNYGNSSPIIISNAAATFIVYVNTWQFIQLPTENGVQTLLPTIRWSSSHALPYSPPPLCVCTNRFVKNKRHKSAHTENQFNFTEITMRITHLMDFEWQLVVIVYNLVQLKFSKWHSQQIGWSLIYCVSPAPFSNLSTRPEHIWHTHTAHTHIHTVGNTHNRNKHAKPRNYHFRH